MCPPRGPPEGSSSPLGTYSSPAGHHITPHNLTSPLTPHNLTSPLYLPLSTYMLVEHPAPHYAQRLDWVRGNHMPRDQHASLTCRAALTNCLSIARYDGEFACATRQASVDRHEPLGLAVLQYLPSAATRHVRMLHFTFGID
jgi:hypothetical protein